MLDTEGKKDNFCQLRCEDPSVWLGTFHRLVSSTRCRNTSSLIGHKMEKHAMAASTGLRTKDAESECIDREDDTLAYNVYA